MFYVKKQLADGCEIRVPLEEENVFTVCPDCGAEHNVPMGELAELITDEKIEDHFESIRISCEKCSKRRAAERGV